jgi:hypothetical protein
MNAAECPLLAVSGHFKIVDQCPLLGVMWHSEAAQPVQIRGTAVVRAHQPDEAVFRSILPEDIDWKPFAAFPPSVRLAILVGHPSEPGPYLIRVKVPSGVKLMPHRHPEDRIYTVMSGVFYIGLGDISTAIG